MITFSYFLINFTLLCFRYPLIFKLLVFRWFNISHTSCRTNGEEATGVFWQKISPALEYALQIKFNQKKAATNFSAGVKYALDSDNSVKVCTLRVLNIRSQLSYVTIHNSLVAFFKIVSTRTASKFADSSFETRQPFVKPMVLSNGGLTYTNT